MKRIIKLFCVLCLCFVASGCKNSTEAINNTKEESKSVTEGKKYTTECTLTLSNHSSFTYFYHHDRKIVSSVSQYALIFFDTVSEAMEQEEKIRKETCDNDNAFDCDVTRTDKTVSSRVYYDCVSEENCNYKIVIADKEDQGYVCKEEETD